MLRQPPQHIPRLHLRQDRKLLHALPVVRNPVHHAVAKFAEMFGGHVAGALHAGSLEPMLQPNGRGNQLGGATSSGLGINKPVGCARGSVEVTTGAPNA